MLLLKYERSNDYCKYFDLLASLWRKNAMVHKGQPVTPDFILTEIEAFQKESGRNNRRGLLI